METKIICVLLILAYIVVLMLGVHWDKKRLNKSKKIIKEHYKFPHIRKIAKVILKPYDGYNIELLNDYLDRLTVAKKRVLFLKKMKAYNSEEENKELNSLKLSIDIKIEVIEKRILDSYRYNTELLGTNISD